MNLGGPASTRLPDGLRAVFFSAPVPSWCTLTIVTVERQRFDLDPDDLLVLQGRKDTIQHTCPGPDLTP